MASPRLRDFPYQGIYTYSLTLCCYQRRKYFTHDENVSECLNILRMVLTQRDFTLYCYCFMPNHLHTLITGNSTHTNIKNLIHLFKQRSGYQFKQRTGHTLWQASYFDHVLRKDEKIVSHAHYILENPVRAKIVSDYRDYPYSGSDILDWKNLR